MPKNDPKKLQEFIDWFDSMKKQDKMDLSSDQDLSIAIMNLIWIEEHFFFTWAKLQKTEYYDMIKDIREMRKDLLKQIVKEYEWEVWCISKHLLSASMRLMEVWTKQLWIWKEKEAYDLFNKAYDLYSLFWWLNMWFISSDWIKKINDNALDNKDTEKSWFMWKFWDLVRKAVNCCIE